MPQIFNKPLFHNEAWSFELQLLRYLTIEMGAEGFSFAIRRTTVPKGENEEPCFQLELFI